VILQNYF